MGQDLVCPHLNAAADLQYVHIEAVCILQDYLPEDFIHAMPIGSILPRGQSYPVGFFDGYQYHEIKFRNRGPNTREPGVEIDRFPVRMSEEVAKDVERTPIEQDVRLALGKIFEGPLQLQFELLDRKRLGKFVALVLQLAVGLINRCVLWKCFGERFDER